MGCRYNEGVKFKELAEYLQKLESTASRLEMTRVLADLFSKTSPEDAHLAVYLMQGRLGPAYKSPDFGVADKMMIRALGEGAEAAFRRMGDMGKAAEELTGGRGKGLEVKEVFEKLMAIAQAGGEGSQEKKLQLIRELIGSLSGLEAKYAVKMTLGKLRTGFSDMTVLDSLSWMITGDKKLRGDIERMYNVRADLGEIAEEMVQHKKPREIKPEIGTPILMAKGERAVSAEEIWTRNGECAVEYKLDGLRMQAHIKKNKAQLYSRGMEDMTPMFPEVAEALAKQIVGDCVIEGEVIAVGSNGRFLPFQETAQRKRKYNIEEMAGKIPLKMYVFDVLVQGGEDVMRKAYSERRAILEKIVKEGDGIRLMPRILAKSVGDIEKFFKLALADGTEGVFAKRLEGPYQAGGRDFNWIKYKKSYDKSALADTVDAVVMGYDVGQGKRVGFGIGDFLVGIYDSEKEKYLTVAKIGTGLSDEEWVEMKKKIDSNKAKAQPESFEVKKEMKVDVWGEPKLVVEIQADEITKSPMHSSEYALRFPRFLGWREKKAEDATSLQELKIMFKMQEEGRNGR